MLTANILRPSVQIFDKKTKGPAVFSYAAIFSSSDDYETGNYVPSGQEAPVGLEAKFM